MPRLFIEYLDGSNIYICKYCNTHFTALNELISRAFQGQTGKAFLFNKVVNVRAGQQTQKKLLTGVHVVSDIFCVSCGTLVGWKYIHASQDQQKYKQGKFILEKAHLSKQNWIE